ncbi:MAG: helix-turn-helix domain-containing protein [Opitutaceae bacterium]
MDAEQSNELKDSITLRNEAGSAAASKIRAVDPQNEVTAARIKLGLTQGVFAQLLDTPIGTVRGWEQGRRQPPPCAKVLMRVAMKYPRVVLECSGGEAVQSLIVDEQPEPEVEIVVEAEAEVHHPGGDADFWLL